jgi:dipeptidyl aminopeptidase/acylaminoacyl peptidase
MTATSSTDDRATVVASTPEQVYRAYLNRQELVSGGAVPSNWTQDGGFWFVKGEPENTVILKVDLETGEAVPMFDVPTVRAALTAATGHEPPYSGLPFVTFTQTADGQVEFQYDDARWRLDPATSRLERVEPEPDRLKPGTWVGHIFPYIVEKMEVPEARSPSGAWFAGVREDNIVLRSTRDGREQQLTSDGTPDVYWDIDSQRVSPWSPDGLTLLAYRRDMTGVFRMPRVHWLKPFEEVEFIPYQKAGAKLDRIEPVFVDLRSGRQIPVALDELEDRYPVLLGWHPDGSEALISVYTRDCKRVDIIAANRVTGAVRTLLSETARTFVKVQHDAFAGKPGFHVLPDGGGFLWVSTRDGWNHIYRYDWNGELVGQLTSGEWPVYEVVHSGSDGFVYFTGAIDQSRPYDVHVCRVPLSGGEIEQLTHEKGIHSVSFAPGGQVFLDTHSTVDRPTRTDLVRADGTRVMTVSEMDISRLEFVGYTPAEEFTVKAADGETDLWGVLYKPFDFDPSISYPVIEYIYAGPQTIAAQRFFSITERHYSTAWALAQLGYIVVCLDGRGTPGRSKAFLDVIYGNWDAGVPDHAGAIRQLCARHPWMDAHRVGIFGHSWGGYFSACALMYYPEVYHASVSSAPGPNPWDLMIWEPYLDLPQRNPEAYDRSNLLEQAEKVKGKLMLVVGTSDHYNINTTLKMTRALIDKGIDHELVVLPQAHHGYTGLDQEYYLMKLTGWFDRHVKNRRKQT